MEQQRLERIANRWVGDPVEVGHHIQEAGVLSVGSSAGTLEETDDTGVLLMVQSATGSVEPRFFPWTAVVSISTSAG
jgi:hypothetical protein